MQNNQGVGSSFLPFSTIRHPLSTIHASDKDAVPCLLSPITHHSSLLSLLKLKLRLKLN